MARITIFQHDCIIHRCIHQWLPLVSSLNPVATNQAQLSRIYGEIVCKGFFRSFYNLWRLQCTCQQKLYEIHLLVVTIRVNCAAAHLCQPKQTMIKQQSNDKASNYTYRIRINSQVARLFADNFREFAIFNQFIKKYSSYIFLLNQGRCIFKKKLISKGR